MPKINDYMPDYYKGVYEIEELLKSEQKSFDKFDDLMLKTLLNQFVMQADESGISIFENQLGINPEPTDSLENRRYNVLMRMLPPKPITIKYFRELLKRLNIPATVDVEYTVRNVITRAKAAEINKQQIKRLKYLLNVYLPANLTFQIFTTAETSSDLNIFVGSTSTQSVSTYVKPRLKTSQEVKTFLFQNSKTPQYLVETKVNSKNVNLGGK